MTHVAIRRFADLDALSRAAVEDLAAVAHEAVAARGACHVALSGGSTPKRLFALLASLGRDALPWDHIVLWWGDERTVPADHADSNYRMARETLLEPLALARVHPIDGGATDPDAAARAYEAALVDALGAPPVLDLVWLGMGPDGHTASLFPGTAVLDERERWVVTNEDALHPHPRLTFTFPAIAASQLVVVTVAGAEKAEAFAKIRDGADLPAGRVTAPEVIWLVDPAAAGS